MSNNSIKRIEYICKNCKCVEVKQRRRKQPLTEKKCRKCLIIKDISNFNSNGKTVEGYSKKYKSQCKDCIRVKASEIYYKRKERGKKESINI